MPRAEEVAIRARRASRCRMEGGRGGRREVWGRGDRELSRAHIPAALRAPLEVRRVRAPEAANVPV